ncbi:MAG TPA: shikimate kinase, partial [Candidatus Binataceae bacterium]|nr:shikimate kinase [Candidatus Binataceae bacterium]
SIVLLKRLAAAIDVPLTELVDEGPRPSAEYLMLAQRLRRLTSEELAMAATMIAERFGRSRNRLDRIALVGLRGAGKTTLGKLLADHLGWEFLELSSAIEQQAGVALAEIFEFGGQAAYRRYELRALEASVSAKRGIVLAAGGGLVAEAAALERLLDACYTVWLQASPQEHWDRVLNQGDDRVRAGTRDSEALADMQRILAQRVSLYGMADAQLNTSGRAIPETFKELVKLVARRGETSRS